MVFRFFPLEMIYCTFNWWRFPHLLGIQKGFLEAQWPHEYMDPSLASRNIDVLKSKRVETFLVLFTKWFPQNLMVDHHFITSGFTCCSTFIYPISSPQSRTLPRAPRITLSASAKPKFMGSSTSASVNLIMPNTKLLQDDGGFRGSWGLVFPATFETYP